MFDAVVIGGGLAGCSAATTLARRGRRVLLLEAGAYPRPKVCGEFLSPESMALFTALGVDDTVMALNPVEIRTVRITASGGAEWRGRFPAPALGVSRFALDAALAGHAVVAGVDVRSGAKVLQVTGSLRDGFSLTIEGQSFEAKTVIAAHGKRSALDRAFGRHSGGPFLALKRHFHGPPLPNHIDLHVFPGGYCGMSQVETGATNVCLLVQQRVFQAAAGGGADAVARFVAWMCDQNARVGRWLRQASPVYDDWLSIAQVSVAAKSPIEGDVLLAGDSAGMVAPLAGDGMAMALHAGMLAADHIDQFLQHTRDADAVKREYAAAWRRTFAGRLRLGRALNAVMLQPRLIGPGLRLMARLPALGDWLVRQTRDFPLLKETT